MSKFLVIFNTKIIFVQFVYMSIFLFIYQYRDLFFIFFYNFYAIATCFQKRAHCAHPSVCTGILLEYLIHLL